MGLRRQATTKEKKVRNVQVSFWSSLNLSMKVLSINARGVGTIEKRRWIKELCVKEKVDMVGIQETKQKNWVESQVYNLWGHDNGDFIQSQAVGNSGGLLLIWDKGVFNCDFYIVEKSFVAAIGNWNGTKGHFGFVNVYGPRDQKEREEMWKNIECLCSKEDVNWCVFGDFNEVRGSHERLNSITNERGVESFNSFINHSGYSGLVEIRWVDKSLQG